MVAWIKSAPRDWRSAYVRWRYSWDGRAPVMGLAIAVLLGLVLGLGLGRVTVPEGGRAPAEAGRAQLSEGVQRAPATQGARAVQQDPTSDRLDSCEAVYRAQTRPLRSVGPAMAQWEVHIGAMNKLVVGAIGLPQATQFWNQTREGAARKLAKFGEAHRDFDQRTTRCPTRVGRPSGELGDCASVVAARQHELRRAAVALDTWQTHVRHMEMLRRGEMSPAAATRMWLENWRHGTRQVAAYRSAARAVDQVAASHRHHHGGAEGPCAG